MNGPGGAPSPSNGFYDQRSTGVGITGGKDVRYVGLQYFRVGIDRVPAGDLQFFNLIVFVNKCDVRSLTDRCNEHINFHQRLGAFDRYRSAPATGIRFAEFHFLKFQLGNPVFVTDNAGRCRQKMKLSPSCSAATISTSLAGISLRVRR